MATADTSRRAARRTGRLGPAFVTAALVFGPGSITTFSSLGASYAYDLIWVPVVATILMLCFVDLGVRIGLTTDRGPVSTISRRLGRIVAVLVGVGSFLVTASFQAGNSVGTGAAGNVLFGADVAVVAAVFTAVGVALLWVPSFYKALERIMVVLIAAMLVVFVITAVVSRPDVSATLLGLVPSIPSGSTALVVAATATTFSVVGALYQIQLVREKGWTAEDHRVARQDAVLGTLTLGLLSLVMMIAAAAVLNPKGVTVESPTAMAAILEPTVGGWASALFAVGLWAAAFSSLMGNSTIGGHMIAGALGLEAGGLSSAKVKACIATVMVIGGVVAVIFGDIPIQLIVTAQAVTILAVPLIGVAMVLLARHRDRGRLAVGNAQLGLSLVGVAFLFVLAYTFLQALL